MKYLFTLILILLIPSYNKVNCKNGRWAMVDSFAYKFNNNILETKYKAIDCADEMNCTAIANVNSEWPWNRTTTNGGLTWFTTLKDTLRWDSVATKSIKPAAAEDISYPDTNLCLIACDSGYIWRSTDKCKTWSRIKVDVYIPPPKPYTIITFEYKIKMFDINFGIFKTNTEIFITNNGGLKWKKVLFNFPDSLLPLSFDNVEIPDSNTIILLSYNNTIKDYLIISTDRGRNWNSTTPFKWRAAKDISFINKNTGWACGSILWSNNDESFYSDIIYHTTNHGLDWDIQLDTFITPRNWNLKKIKFIDSKNGITLGKLKKLLRTYNGGKS